MFLEGRGCVFSLVPSSFGTKHIAGTQISLIDQTATHLAVPVSSFITQSSVVWENPHVCHIGKGGLKQKLGDLSLSTSGSQHS